MINKEGINGACMPGTLVEGKGGRQHQRMQACASLQDFAQLLKLEALFIN